MDEVWFTGFDSAWGGRNPGALCDLRGEVSDGRLSLSLHARPNSVFWEGAVAAIASYEGRVTHIIGIDQGLIVPNATGMRPVERRLAKSLMGSYGCGAHASNRGNVRCYGPTAGIWKYQQSLIRYGYRQCPLEISRRTRGRFYFECYPHPALIGLFNLQRVLKYKVHHCNHEAWAECVGHVRSLATRDDLPITNIRDHVPEQLKPSKPNEDCLDAIIAAYTAAHWWWLGTMSSVMIGDLQTGYIVTPCTEEMAKRLRAEFGDNINQEGCAIEHQADIENAKGVSVLPFPDLPDGSVGSGEVPGGTDFPWHEASLMASDSGNLWCNANPWMIRERCVGWNLEIRFLDQDDEPILLFIPFDQHGGNQFGMKPGDEDCRLLWRYLARGASRNTPQVHHVEFRYWPSQP